MTYDIHDVFVAYDGDKAVGCEGYGTVRKDRI